MNKIKKGDFVLCRRWDFIKDKASGNFLEGVVEEISDGSEKGIPSELMYGVHMESNGILWLHRKEIIGKMKPKSQIKAIARLLYKKQNKVVNNDERGF